MSYSKHKHYTKMGLLIASVFMLASCWGVWREFWTVSSIRVAGIGIGIILSVTTFCSPAFFRLPYIIWMSLGKWMGIAFSRIVMVLFFFGPILIVGLVMRILSRDPLLLRKPPTGSCWKNRTYDPEWDDPQVNYFNQF